MLRNESILLRKSFGESIWEYEEQIHCKRCTRRNVYYYIYNFEAWIKNVNVGLMR